MADTPLGVSLLNFHYATDRTLQDPRGRFHSGSTLAHHPHPGVKLRGW